MKIKQIILGENKTEVLRKYKYPEIKTILEELYNEYDFYVAYDKIEDFLSKALDEQKKEVIEEMIKLSDKIEAERETPDIQEWKAFKHFRNTMRDKLKKIKEL